MKKTTNTTNSSPFLPPFITNKPTITIERGDITNVAGVISADVSTNEKERGELFAQEIKESFISDFKKEGDLMVHVSTFLVIDGMIYMSYYANTETTDEKPEFHKSRLVYCPVNNLNDKVYIDMQSAGDEYWGKKVDAVYDTILMTKDNETLFILWTASLDGNYYRLYRTFHMPTKTLGDIYPNHLKVEDDVVDFNITDMVNVFAEHKIGCKKIYTDIGIMQKLSTREENGRTYYYSGAYCGDCNFIIKSEDLITWQYVSQPTFINNSQWENAVYVVDDKCYYFVRQWKEKKEDENDLLEEVKEYGFLTFYDLNKKIWADPVLIEDCQSRSDFIMYNGELYLFHAPIDREHICIVHINRQDLSKSKVVLQANMGESCFYPYIQYIGDDVMGFSYTCNRQHIKFSQFYPDKYLLNE